MKAIELKRFFKNNDQGSEVGGQGPEAQRRGSVKA